MVAKWYLRGLRACLSGETEWTADTIKVALMKAAHAPDQDAHSTWASISADEIVPASNPGYSAGGFTLTGKSAAQSSADNIVSLNAADVVWNGTISAAYAVVYDSTNGFLLGYVDFGGTRTSEASTFTLDWPSGVVLRAIAA